MASLEDTDFAELIRNGESRTSLGDGLYFVVPKRGQAYWAFRYVLHKKRKLMTLGKYQEMLPRDAREEAILKAREIRTGIDPIRARKKAMQENIHTVNTLFEDWHKGNVRRLKYPEIPERVYRKDIAPHIGEFLLSQVTARDIRNIIEAITASGRPTVSNDALAYCKQLFNHGIKLDLVGANPAAAFNVSDAGGIEKSKVRHLTIEEVTHFFNVAYENSDSFSRENYIAISLLICLGVRKSELVEAKWSEFDLPKRIWFLPNERSKTGVGISIPLSETVIEWIQELQVRACDSEYIFPNRRAGKAPHMGKDTLNRAITKLFGHEAGKKKQPLNLMGKMNHFTVHDLRRTCRTLLAKQGTLGHVAERCLNHKLKGIEGIYNQHDYFDERKEALDQLSLTIANIVNR
ncbi:DUF4102 domain-containing protein [Parashewanella spongiae]|uniref:DUF4102 domain-containing protein n=1 Tax=Parashewanella spongiae TaxID=342950 RepID=A0A3A6UI60_9GAMM|nr:site-specific integrase [Parashewanella spongiae]MCL1077038.1 site-specific integrase [Parashewanella spongiae]RJY18748.1 DUF4102 domain-containing protein [Parashewanella spongiae]